MLFGAIGIALMFLVTGDPETVVAQTTETTTAIGSETTVSVPAPETTSNAGGQPAFVDGQCNETSFTGRVISAEVDGVALSYAEVEATLTALLGQDCAASVHIFWVGETYYEGSDTPLCFAILGGGGGQVDAEGVFYGGHTVNAGSVRPLAGSCCSDLCGSRGRGQRWPVPRPAGWRVRWVRHR